MFWWVTIAQTKSMFKAFWKVNILTNVYFAPLPTATNVMCNVWMVGCCEKYILLNHNGYPLKIPGGLLITFAESTLRATVWIFWLAHLQTAYICIRSHCNNRNKSVRLKKPCHERAKLISDIESDIPTIKINTIRTIRTVPDHNECNVWGLA